jgi:hypothetical protein
MEITGSGYSIEQGVFSDVECDSVIGDSLKRLFSALAQGCVI